MPMLLAACNGRGATLPHTPLFSDIPARATHQERQAMLANRLAQKFKVGRPENGLEKYLMDGGVKTSGVTGSLAPGRPIYGEARIKYGPVVCNIISDVHSRADAKGQLTELNVEHSADLWIAPPYLCADLGIELEPREDHAAYLGRWLEVLKGDKRAIFWAAAYAQTAADLVVGLQPERGRCEPWAPAGHPGL